MKLYAISSIFSADVDPIQIYLKTIFPSHLGKFFRLILNAN
jgi:hypothetical protein